MNMEFMDCELIIHTFAGEFERTAHRRHYNYYVRVLCVYIILRSDFLKVKSDNSI